MDCLADYSASTVIACVGHAFTQAMHMMQSSGRVALAFLSPLTFTMSYTFIGQTSAHTPAPSQASRSTNTLTISNPLTHSGLFRHL